MHILDHLRYNRATSASHSLARCIEALDDYMKTLRLDDPMRDKLDKTIDTLDDLYDAIKARKEQK